MQSIKIINMNQSDSSSNKEAPRSCKNSKDTYKFHKVIGSARTHSARRSKAKELGLTQDEKEEKERSDYERSVFSHHEASTRSASTSSFRAKNVKLLSAKTIRTTKVAIDTFEHEVEQFNEDLKELIKREEDRIEHEEKVKANAGQPLDYFQLPKVAKLSPRASLNSTSSAKCENV